MGVDDQASADHATAVQIADVMRATHGDGLLVTPAHFEAMVAIVSSDAARNIVMPADTLTKIINSEQGTLKAALPDFSSRETIKVEGNTIVMDNKTTGKLKSGEATFADTHAVFYVATGKIVAVEVTHSPEALANLKKIIPRPG